MPAQISQVLDKEIPEEAQCAGLAPSHCIQQGTQVSIALNHLSWACKAELGIVLEQLIAADVVQLALHRLCEDCTSSRLVKHEVHLMLDLWGCLLDT